MAKETLHGNLTEEIVDAEICRRLNDNEDDEYLVDGALLSCTSAKWEAFDLSDGGKIEIDGVEEKSKTGKATEYLRVPENPMSANNLRYATVADTKQGWNIMPFPCNCKEPALSAQEEKDWNGENTYHPNGQFGAILIATENGIPKYAVMKASTPPDNMENAATICEGVYEASSVRHSVETDDDGNVIFGGYAALQLNNSNNISAYNSKTGNDYANGIHFHMAGYIKSDNPKSPYSKGCITIPVQDYLEFGVKVGFIKGEAVDDIGEIWETYDGDDYQEAKRILPYNTYAQEFDGHMVIDRQYYDDKDKYLKFNGSRSEE